jgi:hypothetical protein
MDILTLKAALKKAASGSAYDAAEALQAAKDYADTLVFTDESVQASNHDRKMSYGLLLTAFRQHVWQNKEDAPLCETGTVTLTNTAEFPFNDSKQSVALGTAQPNKNYAVIAWTESEAGNIGDIQVTEKQVNGFKVRYSGSAATAVVNYIVIGGIVK